MPNGDIVSGCSDGVVRVFSADEARWAPADELKAYEDKVAAQALPAEQVGDVKKSDLPGPEALAEPGASPPPPPPHTHCGGGVRRWWC